MPSSKTFGRRAPLIPVSFPAIPKMRSVVAVDEAVPEAVASPGALAEPLAIQPPVRQLLSVAQEVKEWDEARKIRKRSFREPWRSVSIVAGLAFFATSWLVPEDVANVAQFALGVLTAGSFYAGWRAQKTT